jgi:hypothetical protein
VFCDISAGNIASGNGMWQRVTLVDGNAVRDAFSDVQNHTRGSSGSVEAQNTLRCKEESGATKGFKKYLGSLISVGSGV